MNEEEKTAPALSAESPALSAESPAPVEEEASPLGLLLDEIDTLKAHVAALEQAVQNHSHTIDAAGLDNIARHVEQYLLARLRQRSKPRME